MKRSILTALAVAIVLTMALTLASCSPSVDDMRDVLRDWEKDDYVDVEKLSRSDREEFLDEALEELEEMDIEIDIDGDLEEVFLVEGRDEGMAILVFEKLSDAKKAAKIDLADIDDRYWENMIDEYDGVVLRRGKVVFFGSEDLIKDFLDEL